MKKEMAVLLAGMVLAACSVYGAERIEKEPVKVLGESVRAPEAENVRAVPVIIGKDMESAVELLEREGLKAFILVEETEDRKEAVRNAAKGTEQWEEKAKNEGD